nr:MAG: hypothetical protein DIU78_12180 [Pseudomonadota bacterium]
MARLLPLRRCRETTLISDELLSFQGLALEKHRGFFRALLFVMRSGPRAQSSRRDSGGERRARFDG